MKAADQTFHLTQSQYTDTGPTSPSADPITPGAWQGSHWSAYRSRGGRLTTRPTRRSVVVVVVVVVVMMTVNIDMLAVVVLEVVVHSSDSE